MFADKSAVLAQINSVIENKSIREKAKEFGYLAVNRMPEKTPAEHKIPSVCTNNREQLRKLQQRVESLEEHSDHLLYFIHFLFQTFAEPLQHLLDAEATKENVIPQKLNELPVVKSAAASCIPCNNMKVSLTKREYEIFNLLIKGLCAKEIANKLFISEATVITHKKHMKEKFKAKNTAEFISRATAISREGEGI